MTRRCLALGVSQTLAQYVPFVAFVDLHELTPTLSGPERMACFEALLQAPQDAMYASLRTSLEKERAL